MNLDFILGNALRAAFGPEAAVYALAAMGLNVHYGYTGLLNFGQVGFMLVGAYGVAISVVIWGLPLWVGVLVGVAASLVLALILGLPTLRLRADYFAIVTIAAAEILRFVFRSSPADPLTRSVFGIQGFAGDFYLLNPIPRGRYGIGLLSYTHVRLWAMVVSWLLVALAAVAVYLLMRAPWGRVLRSIREDEDAARSLGKDAFSYKMQSLVLGGVMGSVAGMMFAITPNSVHPDAFLPIVTFYAYTILILGGPARVLGPIVGAMIFFFFLEGLDSFLRQAAVAADSIGAIRFASVGAVLMLLVAFRPQGIFGDKRELSLEL